LLPHVVTTVLKPIIMHCINYRGKTYIPNGEFILSNLQAEYGTRVKFTIIGVGLYAQDIADDVDLFQLGATMQRIMDKPYCNGVYYINTI